jgi:branched-chain amino acid transport system permease protein
VTVVFSDPARRRLATFAAMAVVVAVVPVFVRNDYYRGELIRVGINAIVVVGLNLLMGYAGQISLGHAAFVGIGAYSSAILTVRAGLSPWLALIAAVLITAAVAAAVGGRILRLRGHYLAMATLGFGMIIHAVAIQWGALTGSDQGIAHIPPLAVGGWRLVSWARPLNTYYTVWIIALLVLLGSSNIVSSRVGRAMRAVHGSEIAADTSGVNTARYKLQVFVLSAVLAGLAGSLYAHYMGYIDPGPFSFIHSIDLVVMVVIGGMASTWGAVLGAGAVQFLDAVLGAFLERRLLVFGLVLVLIMIFLPQGLARGGADIAALLRRRKQARAA